MHNAPWLLRASVAIAYVVRRVVVSTAIVGVWHSGPTTRAADAPSFAADVIPVLTRFGCNAGGCHGKLAGQNGFRLSLRGYAPELDFESIVREGRGRRVNLAAPEHSLLFRKAVGLVPHGGGTRFPIDGAAANILRDWIAVGAPNLDSSDAQVERLEISPYAAILPVGQSQSLSVTAFFVDGRQRDVTWLTQFAAGDPSVLDVTAEGVVTASRPGESVVRASFQGQIEIATITTPFSTPIDQTWYAQRNNVIDDHVFDKLSSLHIKPSPLCDDATFVRRSYLDAIGTLPTVAEVQAFLDDSDPQKRSRLVDLLLQRPEFIDFWALQLGDLLQNRRERDHDVRGVKGVRAMHAWLRQQLAAGASWRDIASQVLTAQGSCEQSPAVGFYVVTVGEKDAEQSEVADSVAQAFLGARIGCARCHNHPLEKYTQDDYYHFVAFFSRVSLDRKPPQDGATELVIGTRHMLGLRNELRKKQVELSGLREPPGQDSSAIGNLEHRIDELERQIEEARLRPTSVAQPRTGKLLTPRPWAGAEIEVTPGVDPRSSLVKWMMVPENEYFSGAMVNRLWKHFMAVGLVEPVDDLRATNPPSNRPLWQALTREFTNSGYDLRHVMRLIMTSRAYQLSSDTQDANALDDRYYSHFYARRLSAEVLLDAISQVTATAEPFPGYPVGTRAIQIPDAGVDSYFLSLFGRSERTTACACERKADVTLPQLLHLQNSDELSQKLQSPDSRLSQLLSADATNDDILDALFVSTLGHMPSDDQRLAVADLLQSGDRREVLLDLFWALLNSKEFTFNR